MTAILEFDPISADSLVAAAGAGATALPDLAALLSYLERSSKEDAVVLGPSVEGTVAFDLAARMRLARPALGIVLVRRRADAALLTDALRHGVREVVQDRDLAGVSAAVARVREFAAALRGELVVDTPSRLSRHGRVVTVFSAKGGCGKTTVSTNLAAVLAEEGHKVVLLDLDLAFGDVAIALQLHPAHTIADVIPLGDNLDAAALRGMLTPHRSGLMTLAAPLDPGTHESIEPAMVAKVIDLLAEEFDVVVIDTPPALDEHVLTAFDRSDVVALLATLDIPALKNLKLTLETLDLLAYPKDRLRVVLNRSDAKVGLSAAEVEKTLHATICSQIPSSREVPAATNRGVAITSDQPRHPVSIALREFADTHVVPLIESDTDPAKADRRGMRLFRRAS